MVFLGLEMEAAVVVSILGLIERGMALLSDSENILYNLFKIQTIGKRT